LRDDEIDLARHRIAKKPTPFRSILHIGCGCSLVDIEVHERPFGAKSHRVRKLLLMIRKVVVVFRLIEVSNAVPIYDPNTKRAEYISAKARTVIIDNRLLAENQRHRYRFTLGHEAGHDILHSAFFAYNPDQMNMFDTPTPPMIQCRVDAGKASNKNLTQWDDHDWMEWQANRLSSAILMPKSAVMKIVSKFKGDPKMLSGAIKLTRRISETFDMSDESALYRLKSLGVIPETKATATPQIMLLEDFFG